MLSHCSCGDIRDVAAVREERVLALDAAKALPASFAGLPLSANIPTGYAPDATTDHYVIVKYCAFTGFWYSRFLCALLR